VRGELQEELVLRGLSVVSSAVGIAHDEPLPRRSTLFPQPVESVEKRLHFPPKVPV
jgi:hypothetical protein